MTSSLVTCLCVTHERPQWLDWTHQQVDKQTLVSPLDVFVSGYGPKTGLGREMPAAIAPKRNIALAGVVTPYFAWFDDDDWSHPERLSRCVELLEACPRLVAAGPIDAYKIDARTLRSTLYHAQEERLIFNGTVFRTDYWKSFRFDERMAIGEDQDWMKRGLRHQAFGAINQILCSWLCHTSNIANRADRVMFHERFPAELTAFRAELETNPEYSR